MTGLYNGIHRHFVRACLVAAALGAFASACKHTEVDEGPGAPTGPAGGPGTAVEISRAQDEITQARCDMEERCKNVGADKTFADRNQCMTKVRDSWKDDLNFSSCSGGVDAGKLDTCLTQLRNHECGSVLDNLSRVVECRTGALCRG